VAENAELLVIRGADPMVTLKIGYAPPDHEGLKGFAAFRDRGAPAVVIDPRRTATADDDDADLADLVDRLGHAAGSARQPETALIRSDYDSCAAQAARIGIDRDPAIASLHAGRATP
jgi:hypothetical protein